ncbi:hypothetical protein niasHS_013929 [Heterodera schachtii]|uniref:Uncharacterized protein n=1 Tax=Heterodera schachtii TaxID=97005 RepID=A0ABD2IKH5_HETSC
MPRTTYKLLSSLLKKARQIRISGPAGPCGGTLLRAPPSPGTVAPTTNERGRLTAMVFAVNEGSAEIVKLLVESGANVNLMDYEKKTSPLIIGCQEDRFACVQQMLFSPEVDRNITDKYGQTPLIHAVICGRRETAKLLITHGANVQKVDNFGKTALNYAIEMNDDEGTNNKLIGILRGNSVRPSLALPFPSIAFLFCLVCCSQRQIVGQNVTNGNQRRHSLLALDSYTCGDLRRSARLSMKARKCSRKIYVCNDIWLHIFPWLNPAKVGLKLALLSVRFDCLVQRI